MPPKKPEAPAGPVEDTNPYGVFFNVSVPTCRLFFVAPSTSEDQAAAGASPVLPTTHLSLSYPPPSNPSLVGEPTAAEPSASSEVLGVYHHAFDKKFRRDPGLASLHALLNAPPVLSLHDSGTGAVLASVPLDLTPLGLGHTSLTLNDLLLDLAPQPDAAGAATPGSAAAAKPAGASKPATPQQGAKKGADAGAAAADPTPVPTAKLAGRPLVPELTLRLTHREAPLADGAGASSPGGATPPVPGSKPPSKPATPTPTPPSAAAETAGDTLPEPLPYSFLPEGPGDQDANVLTLEVLGAGPAPLPPGLLASHSAAPGKLGLQLALVLPPGAGAPLVLPGGGALAQSADGSGVGVSWPGAGRLRRVLTGPEARALLSALDQAGPGDAVVGLELARVVAEDKAVGDTQAAWDAYHAWLPLTGAACLLEGGTSSVPSAAAGDDAAVEEVPLLAWPPSSSSSVPPLASVLPAFVPPAGKVKALEELPGGVMSAWHAAGSTLAVRLTLARPLVPPWMPPPAPQPSLQELVPQRVLHPPPPPATAQQDLQATLGTILQQLARAYAQHQQQQQRPQGAAGALVDAPPEVAHKALIRDLNKSGQYLEWRDSLKRPLLRVVREQLGKSGGMASAEMAPHLPALHTQLVDQSRASIHQAAAATGPTPPPAQPPPPTPKEMGRLAALAGECAEVVGDDRRAAALLKRRQLDADNLQAHLDAARLTCRRAARPQAPPDHCGEEGSAGASPWATHFEAASRALRAALEIDPHHLEALLSTAALHCTWLLVEAPTPGAAQAHPSLALALASAHALLPPAPSSTPSTPAAWALLHLAYTLAGRTQEAGACLQELRRQQRAALALAKQHPAAAPPEGGSPARLVVPLWQLALDLGLAPLAQHAMGLAAEGPSAGPLARAAAHAPLACQLLTARTALLAAQWSSRGGAAAAPPPPQQKDSSVPLIAISTEQQQQDGAAQGSASAPAPAPPGPPGLPSDPAALLELAGAAAKRAQRLIRALPSAALGLSAAPLVEGGATQQDMTAIAEEEAEGEGAATAAAAPSGPPPLTQAQLSRLQLTPLALLGEVEWARASLVGQQAAALERAQGLSRQQYLARRSELRRALAKHKAEARRHFQSALTLLYEQAWLPPSASPSPDAPPAHLFEAAAEAAWVGALEGAGQAATSELELRRALLRLAASYVEDEPLPDCAADVATAAVALWPHSAASWWWVAQAHLAVLQRSGAREAAEAARVALTQANLCDRWDGRTWEQLALHEFRWGKYEDGISALHYALALSESVGADPVDSIARAPQDALTLLQEAARCCEAVGDYEQAARHLAAAAGLAGGEACFQVRHQQAAVALSLGDVVGARQHGTVAQALAATPLQQQQARLLRAALA